MPISKENKKRYPKKKEWGAIRDRILGRAGYRCECQGECGLEHDAGRCAAPQHAKVVRNPSKTRWEFHPHPFLTRPVRIVLTIAHYPDHTIENVADDNLKAVCQLCHLRMDRWHHAANAAKTRMKKREAADGRKPGVEPQDRKPDH